MKITLIQPPTPSSKGRNKSSFNTLVRPFSLFYLAGYLEKHTSFDIEILDFELNKYCDVPVEDVLCNNDSQIFGITATTYTRFEAVKIAKKIKKLYPESWIVTGGVHFMHCAKDTLSRIPEIDIVVRGEGELTLLELAKAINAGVDLETVMGISYRRNNEIIDNPDQMIFEGLDDIPTYTKFSYDEYPEYLMDYQEEKIPAISVVSSRGCPNKCIFCPKGGVKYRLRSPKLVVDEIEYYKKKFRIIEAVNFLDLTFTASPPHVTKVCREIINRKLNIKWWCESRANIPLELLDLMKEAGCCHIAFGIESGSPRILEKISKNVPVENIIDVAKKCSDICINSRVFFTCSHPDETEKDVKETFNLMTKLVEIGSNPTFGITMIFPGTEIEKIAYSKNILPKDFSWYDHYESDLNNKLETLSNIPLFVDKLTPEMLLSIKEKVVTMLIGNRIVKQKFTDLVKQVFKAIVAGNPSAKHIFNKKLIVRYIMSKLTPKRQ